LENPGLEKPGLEKPGLEKPGLEKPDFLGPEPEGLESLESDLGKLGFLGPELE